jgi:hypothetical protein
MQKILLPANGDILSEEFSESQCYRIYHVLKSIILKEESIESSKLESVSLPSWISKKKITDVIADKIDSEVLDKINMTKTNVFIGVKPKMTKQIVDDLTRGMLETANNPVI